VAQVDFSHCGKNISGAVPADQHYCMSNNPNRYSGRNILTNLERCLKCEQADYKNK
jgi:hypothetical protein